jgi:BirA family transcriptional regulator, biotin operon repressor / biotin---[acetyl-CoA-carboxylase] ligase
MPVTGSGTSVPWPGRVVASALICPTLVLVNDVTPWATPRAAARAPLDLGRLQEVAGAHWHVELHAAAESTNVLAAAAPEPGLVVVADHQTAGRGRLGRTWTTPPGAALTFSAVVDPMVTDEWWPLLPLVAGYAVARTVHGSLKWPNDVLVAERKVSGILVERVHARAHGRNRPLAVIGIGVNVDQTQDELPVPSAGSLALQLGRTDRTGLFGSVLAELRLQLDVLTRSPQGWVGSYRTLCTTLGRDVRVDLPDGSVLDGRASAIDEHGRLVVTPRTDGGPAEPGAVAGVPVAAGDVVHVRPAR